MNILQQVARRWNGSRRWTRWPSRWPGRSATRYGRAWCATCSAAPTCGIPAPHADRPADRSVGDVGPAGRRRRPGRRGAADLLVTAGVVAAVPTAAAGLNDWSDTAGPETRVGLVHVAVNTTALSLYLASLVAGARGRRRGGKALGLAGLGVLPGHGQVTQPSLIVSSCSGPPM